MTPPVQRQDEKSSHSAVVQGGGKGGQAISMIGMIVLVMDVCTTCQQDCQVLEGVNRPPRETNTKCPSLVEKGKNLRKHLRKMSQLYDMAGINVICSVNSLLFLLFRQKQQHGTDNGTWKPKSILYVPILHWTQDWKLAFVIDLFSTPKLITSNAVLSSPASKGKTVLAVVVHVLSWAAALVSFLLFVCLFSSFLKLRDLWLLYFSSWSAWTRTLKDVRNNPPSWEPFSQAAMPWI